MEKELVKCVKIIHHPTEVRMYRTLSAFFRFIGIFACENLIEDEYGDKVDWECQITKGSEDIDLPIKEQVNVILQEMKECIGDENFSIVSSIWNVFNENDLMRGSYAIDYFSNSGRIYIYQQMEKAIHSFKEALKQLNVLEQEDAVKGSVGNVYIWMAQVNSQRRINELAMILWNAVQEGLYVKKNDEAREKYLSGLAKKYIKFNKIDKVISRILKVDSQFYAAYAIRGFVKELTEAYKTDSKNDFEKAIKLIGNKSYTSYLYFRIGRYYEKILPDRPEKMYYYENAAAVDGHNFRAIYKMARFEMDMGNYETSIRLWEKVIDVLNIKKDLISLQPVECAYLFKAYQKKGVIYSKLEDYTRAIDDFKKAEKVYNNVNNEEADKGFYPWMFGNQLVKDGGREKKSWEIYKETAREKLNIRELYKNIVDASSRAEDWETYGEYMGKV